MTHRIDHVGLAVRGLEESLRFWGETLGLDVEGIETVATEKVKVAFLSAGASRIELLESTDASSAVARFVEQRGPGVHHLTLAVEGLDALVDRLERRNVEIIGGEAREGAGGTRVAFVHPRSTGGVLLELVERSAATAERPELCAGRPVLLYLRDPQEKLWGVLRQLDTRGVMFEGIELASFDDWVAQIERGEESVVGPSVLFVPMGRLEKILLDRRSGDLPSLAERFQRRTGRTVQQVLGEPGS